MNSRKLASGKWATSRKENDDFRPPFVYCSPPFSAILIAHSATLEHPGPSILQLSLESEYLPAGAVEIIDDRLVMQNGIIFSTLSLSLQLDSISPSMFSLDITYLHSSPSNPARYPAPRALRIVLIWYLQLRSRWSVVYRDFSGAESHGSKVSSPHVENEIHLPRDICSRSSFERYDGMESFQAG